MSFLIVSGLSKPEIAQVDFSHQEISDENATYPIITSGQAFDALKNGQAHIASYEGEGKDISIKEVFIGYYLGDIRQDYLAPVIIFKGTDNFIAYVPAISSQWINN